MADFIDSDSACELRRRSAYFMKKSLGPLIV
jgi:hypothetical protein